MALMYFHLARMDSRQDEQGSLLLLADQDREQWNQQYIAMGLGLPTASGQGEQISRYHVEASIAAEHCMSSSFDTTRWSKIADAYALLEQLSPSPMYRLNRALAVAESEGPEAALTLLDEMEVPAVARPPPIIGMLPKPILLYRDNQVFTG